MSFCQKREIGIIPILLILNLTNMYWMAAMVLFFGEVWIISFSSQKVIWYMSSDNDDMTLMKDT